MTDIKIAKVKLKVIQNRKWTSIECKEGRGGRDLSNVTFYVRTLNSYLRQKKNVLIEMFTN